MDNYGFLSVIPMILLLCMAIKTRKVLESVFVASIATYLILSKQNFIVDWVADLQEVAAGSAFVYVLCIVGAFGGLIRLLQDSGGALGFGNFAAKYANTQRKSLLLTYLLGMLVFIDEYLNALAVTSSMRSLTDKYKVPREMLAMTVNTGGTPMCAIIPFSTWSAFYIALISDEGILEGTGLTGMQMYLKSIPYMVYPFVILIIMFLLIMGWFPKIGTLKKAYQRVETTGNVFPESGAISEPESESDGVKEVKLINFVLPILALIVGTVVSSGDILIGSVLAIATCFILYSVNKTMTIAQLMESFINGIKDMVYILVMVLFIFLFVEGCTKLGFAEYIINLIVPFMTPQLLPPFLCLIIALVSFGVGSYWSISVIALPIVIPMAVQFGLSIPLMLGVLVSAAVFGSQACFYCEVILLAATSAQIEPAEVGFANLPYSIIALLISTGIYGVIACVMV